MIAKPIAITLGNVAGGHGIHVSGACRGQPRADRRAVVRVRRNRRGERRGPTVVELADRGRRRAGRDADVDAPRRSASSRSRPGRLHGCRSGSRRSIGFYEAWLDRLRESRSCGVATRPAPGHRAAPRCDGGAAALAIGAAVGGPALGLERAGQRGDRGRARAVLAAIRDEHGSPHRRDRALARRRCRSNWSTLSEGFAAGVRAGARAGLAVVVGIPMVKVIEPFASTGAIVARS